MTLTLQHQDGDIAYQFVTGGYAIVDSAFYLSIEAAAVSENAFPDTYLFAIAGYPLHHNTIPDELSITTNPDDQTPNVYVYTTFHASVVEAQLAIVRLAEERIGVSINAISDDVNYYNDSAKRNAFVGQLELAKRNNMEQLWIPS